MKLTTLKPIASLIAARQYPKAARAIDQALADEPGPQWQRHLGRLSAFLRDPSHKPFASILVLGNAKLPFLSFSGLPGDACPGAGDCLEWCYSFKAWRYPAAFARQAQNLVLVRENFPAIERAFEPYTSRGPMDFRLYVDGDFDSVETVQKWSDFLKKHPTLSTYGYSKSAAELLAVPDMAPNYTLNISSGHRHSAQTIAKLRRRKMVRGNFIAVDIGRRVSSSEHGDKAHQAELRRAYGKKAFTCPGSCGDCTPTGHACGSARFNNIDIIIAAH